jgi:K+ transporter
MSRPVPKHGIDKVTTAGLIVTLGIIYGDIGTSPLYVMRAIIAGASSINEPFILGGLSCIFWTLTLQTTLKYIIFAIRADNKGEGGIFALLRLSGNGPAGHSFLPLSGAVHCLPTVSLHLLSRLSQLWKGCLSGIHGYRLYRLL